MVVVLLLLLEFARHGRFGLCLLFFTEFGVTDFPAVGDLGQEFADVLNFFFGPGMQARFTDGKDCWGRNFLCSDVPAECHRVDAQLPGRLVRRERFHYSIL